MKVKALLAIAAAMSLAACAAPECPSPYHGQRHSTIMHTNMATKHHDMH